MKCILSIGFIETDELLNPSFLCFLMFCNLSFLWLYTRRQKSGQFVNESFLFELTTFLSVHVLNIALIMARKRNCILNCIQANSKHFIVAIYNIYFPGRCWAREDERGWGVAGDDGTSPWPSSGGEGLCWLRRLSGGSVSRMWRKSGGQQHVARQCQAPMYTVWYVWSGHLSNVLLLVKYYMLAKKFWN